MPDHVVIGQPGADEHLPRIGEVLPDATLTVVDADQGWVADPETTVLFADQPPANAADLERLGWVQLGSHGYAQLSGLPLPADTVVTNASGVQDRPIAEWVVMMLLALGRRFPDMLASQRAHRWDRSVAYQAELRGMQVGLLGYGNIGREVARVLQPLGMRVQVMTRTRNRDRGDRFDPLGRAPDAVPEPDRWFTFEDRAEFYSRHRRPGRRRPRQCRHPGSRRRRRPGAGCRGSVAAQPRSGPRRRRGRPARGAAVGTPRRGRTGRPLPSADAPRRPVLGRPEHRRHRPHLGVERR